MNYDCIIVGAGPAGYFCAYELIKLKKNLKVLIIEKGVELSRRKCPVLLHKFPKCPVHKDGVSGCEPSCSMLSGFGGAGAYSDGKFNITSEFGGWLGEYLEDEEVLSLIKYCDEINLEFGAPKEITNPNTISVKEIEKKAIAVGIKLLRSEVRHIGTEENLKLLTRIYEYLKDKIDFKFETKAEDLIFDEYRTVIKGVRTSRGDFYSDKVVLGVGRDGSYWLDDIFNKYHLPMTNNQVDIGVRVETNNVVMEDINTSLYEGKFVYNTSVGTSVRTFCSNPSGHVVVENNSGVVTANGHSYHDLKLGTNNTNFALLVSHVFDEPFNNPNEYAIRISKIANKLSLGSVIVQRYGDIKLGRRSTKKRISEGFVKPTLKEAIPGDLGLVLPYNTMKSIIEMIEALDHITPGIANEHTLFYGVESKFYSARPVVEKTLELKDVKGLYVAGDGAGLTRGLAQAGASGVYIARNILKE
ncbi:MAG TPA: FAD-dependent oxidoreductase [Candidatus Onthovivens sp.]|nr:FAD-dependent oxidoreductase [Candidatus Onthovivens sp.]